jgi:hypothetical protein
MANDKEESARQDRLMKVLGNAVAYVTNEALILVQYDTVQEGKFPKLWPGNDYGAFDKRMNRVTEHLGGPPAFYLLRKNQEPPLADNYPDTVMREVFDVFQKARRSVIRAHMFMTGSALLAENPDMMDLPQDSEAAALFVKEAQAASGSTRKRPTSGCTRFGTGSGRCWTSPSSTFGSSTRMASSRSWIAYTQTRFRWMNA